MGSPTWRWPTCFTTARYCWIEVLLLGCTIFLQPSIIYTYLHVVPSPVCITVLDVHCPTFTLYLWCSRWSQWFRCHWVLAATDCGSFISQEGQALIIEMPSPPTINKAIVTITNNAMRSCSKTTIDHHWLIQHQHYQKHSCANTLPLRSWSPFSIQQSLSFFTFHTRIVDWWQTEGKRLDAPAKND